MNKLLLIITLTFSALPALADDGMTCIGQWRWGSGSQTYWDHAELVSVGAETLELRSVDSGNVKLATAKLVRLPEGTFGVALDLTWERDEGLGQPTRVYWGAASDRTDQFGYHEPVALFTDETPFSQVGLFRCYFNEQPQN